MTLLRLVMVGGLLVGPVAACASADGDALAELQCASNEVPRWNGSAWVCSASDVLGQLSCAAGAVPKWDGASWVCGMDENSTTTITTSHPVAIDNNNISLALGGVTSDHIANGTIVDSDISPSANIDPDKVLGTAATLTGDQAFQNNSLVIDSVNTRVGVGVAAPTVPLDVSGDVQTTGEYRYSPARMRSKYFGAASFQPAYPETSFDPVYRNYTYNYLYISGGTSSYYSYLLADLNLPNGSTIDSMTCYFYDNSSTVDINSYVRIYRRALTSPTSTTLMTVSMTTSSENSNTMRVISGSPTSPELVDTTTNTYFMRLYWYTGTAASSSARFYGCQVHYTIDRV